MPRLATAPTPAAGTTASTTSGSVPPAARRSGRAPAARPGSGSSRRGGLTFNLDASDERRLVGLGGPAPALTLESVLMVLAHGASFRREGVLTKGDGVGATESADRDARHDARLDERVEEVTVGNIARRADGRWRARYRDAYNREHSRHFDRKIDAQRWLDSVATAVHTGTWVDPQAAKLPIAEWAPRWFETKTNLKPTTRDHRANFKITARPLQAPQTLASIKRARRDSNP